MKLRDDKNAGMRAEMCEESTGSGRTIAVVSSQWHGAITEALVEGAKRALIRSGVSSESISFYTVPGSFELPLFCKQLIQTRACDAVVALGTLIRGETEHFRLIADAVAAGLTQVMLETGAPIGFGVIAADRIELAAERAGNDSHNKGEEAALAVLEMLGALENIHGQSIHAQRQPTKGAGVR